MFFLIEDKELLNKCNKVWSKAKSAMAKNFNSNPVPNDKYLKTKKKSYKHRITTNFNDKVPKKNLSEFVCH